MKGSVLGIETSCDETAAAIVDPEGQVLASKVVSQVDLHRRYGGVVPEIAGRSHLEWMQDVLAETLEASGLKRSELGAVAVTYTPGLVGSLLIGVSAAKAIALALRLPLIPVDHVRAHVFSCTQLVDAPEFPAATLVVSGGHTTLFEVESETRARRVGDTQDDAAGEAFDKVAAILNLAYPGGPSVQRAAERGNRKAHRFPRTLLQKDSLDFSFSGIKTAVLYHCRGQDARTPKPLSETEIADIAASFQEAVVYVLVEKLARLAERAGSRSMCVGGGVAANSRLREVVQRRADELGLSLYLAPMELTGDNAVMVAGLGQRLWQEGVTAGLDLDASPLRRRAGR